MEIAKKLTDIAEKENEEARNKQVLIDLSTQICNIQKQISDITNENNTFIKELERLKSESTKIQTDLQIMKDRENMLKGNIKSYMTKLLYEQDKLDEMQRSVWHKIEDFVSLMNSNLDTSSQVVNNLCDKHKKEHQNHLNRYLQIHTELEVLRMYEIYQQGRIKQLKRATDAMKRDL